MHHLFLQKFWGYYNNRRSGRQLLRQSATPAQTLTVAAALLSPRILCHLRTPKESTIRSSGSNDPENQSITKSLLLFFPTLNWSNIVHACNPTWINYSELVRFIAPHFPAAK
jgi:hypothetical protein